MSSDGSRRSRTHTFIWYLAGNKRLSVPAKEFIDEAADDGDTIAISSITLVEALYLSEKGRIPTAALTQMIQELRSPDSVFDEIPVDYQIVQAMKQVPWADIPDMPDRIIAATAILLGGITVCSRDSKIQASNIKTLW
jgi:PIN domain nuclease of toxin-antitoxin system